MKKENLINEEIKNEEIKNEEKGGRWELNCFNHWEWIEDGECHLNAFNHWEQY